MAAHLFAAIDVGSFELEMGIYETTSRNGLREIDHLRHVISLGRDTYEWVQGEGLPGLRHQRHA